MDKRAKPGRVEDVVRHQSGLETWTDGDQPVMRCPNCGGENDWPYDDGDLYAVCYGGCGQRFAYDCETSPWADWPKDELATEIRDRMRHFYAQTDGTMKFPSSAEGDLLEMAHVLLSPNEESEAHP